MTDAQILDQIRNGNSLGLEALFCNVLHDYYIPDNQSVGFERQQGLIPVQLRLAGPAGRDSELRIS